MRKGLTSVLCFIFFLVFASNVSAVSIFSDGFESGSLNGWDLVTLTGASAWNASSLNPPFGNWTARAIPQYNISAPASVMQKNVSTAGYTNITFSYYRRLSGIDISDEFQAKWFNGTDWTVVEQTANTSVTNTSWIFKTFSLPSSSANNSLFKIRFECTADLLNEDCRVDNILVEGDAAQTGSGNYYGFFSYMNGYDYYVYVNSSSGTVTFTGINVSNQNQNIVIPYNAAQRFSQRINYVWFNGWFDNNNLYLNQYVETGAVHNRYSWQSNLGVYFTTITFPNLPYLGTGLNLSASVNLDSNANISTFTPVLYPQLTSVSPLGSSGGGHDFGPMLFQTRLVNNGTGYDIEVSEWVKQDLALNGLAPRWNVPLNSI